MTPVAPMPAITAGVYVGKDHGQQLAWLASGTDVGARDSHTAQLLANRGITGQLVGCATMTLPRYTGPRLGKYAVDTEPPLPDFTTVTNWIDRDMSWPDQWARAGELLATLAKAELVFTSRLHIALPCLAMGTPVYLDAASVTFQPSRLTIIKDIGIPTNEVVGPTDLTPWVERYVASLGGKIGQPIKPGDIKFPVPGLGVNE